MRRHPPLHLAMPQPLFCRYFAAMCIGAGIRMLPLHSKPLPILNRSVFTPASITLPPARRFFSSSRLPVVSARDSKLGSDPLLPRAVPPSRKRLRKTLNFYQPVLPFLYAPKTEASPFIMRLEHVVPRSILAKTAGRDAVNDPHNIHVSMGYVNHARGKSTV